MTPVIFKDDKCLIDSYLLDTLYIRLYRSHCQSAMTQNDYEDIEKEC